MKLIRTNRKVIMKLNKIFVLQKGDGLDNGVGQYLGQVVGWTDNWDFARKWAKENKGYYQPLEKIFSIKSVFGR